MARAKSIDAEERRLLEDARREKNWKRWGPYLAERQWGTVREDYSADGDAWGYFPHEHARSRAYRWGEDGLLGITDRECRLAFALALWNGRDPILKERLFGLTGPEGNHGEDVKECYFYLDATPTASYLKALYRYPQAEFPYARLLEENRRRGRDAPEFEIADSGVFDGNRFFDVVAEYAKAAPDDILIRIAAANRGPEPAELHLLPTLWFRNTWAWGRSGEGYWPRPKISLAPPRPAAGRSEQRGGRPAAVELAAEHAALGRFRLAIDAGPDGEVPLLLFTENETNLERLYGVPNPIPYVKDAFGDFVVGGRTPAVNPDRTGSKAAARFVLRLPPGGEAIVRLRLMDEAASCQLPFGRAFDLVFERRGREADRFHAARAPAGATAEEIEVLRAAHAGLVWTKQFYHYVVKDWLEGDPAQPAPPASRKAGRNHDWPQLYNRDVISMPDKWEYPWYASWDLAFHAIPFARIDPEFAKEQLILLLREWYMRLDGQIPAYEFSLGDANPPVHAWASWRVYKMTAPRGKRDRRFLARTFQKLLLNFTWWVNRKDPEGRNLFSGGFLGLDNVGLFDRSRPLPIGGRLEEADGTAWMAFYCLTMLSMALELAREDPVYEDVASKFFEHFVAIADAINSLGNGLWDEEDGFYYDKVLVDGQHVPVRVRSVVGLVPLLAVEVLEEDVLRRLPGFRKRMAWFLENRKDLARHISYLELRGGAHAHRLLAVPSREKLERVLRYLFDEGEFLSPFGIRSLSRHHLDRPFVLRRDDREWRISYEPAETRTDLFGGNSNWRGPIWLPFNYLIVEALERYHHFFGDSFRVEVPAGSRRTVTLLEAAREIETRIVRLFLPDGAGGRPLHGGDLRYARDPLWRDRLLFYEYFDGDTGRGCGACHQTGWTALVARCIEDLARQRARDARKRAARPAAAVPAAGR